MKNISIVGLGRLGLCFGLTLEKAGYSVVGCDISEDYIASINNKTLNSDETDVNSTLAASTNLHATTNLEECINHSNVIFIVVSTPSLPDGRYNHRYIDKVVGDIVALKKHRGPVAEAKHHHIVISSTTMPTYCDTVQDRLSSCNCTVSYNPEFIAQETILRDQLQPDMVLIGEGSVESGDVIQAIYEAHTHSKPQVFRMSRTESEICKIALNCFITTKIAFANMIGDIASLSGCDADPILAAIGSDSRVGPKCLKYGYGYGGPCFPRDNRALSIHADDVGVDATISKASDSCNKEHLRHQLDVFFRDHDTSTPVVFDFITYKKESAITEESQQLAFAELLADNGYEVYIKERDSVIDSLDQDFKDKVVFI